MFQLFDSVEQPLLELSGNKLSQEVLKELFAKSGEVASERQSKPLSCLQN